MLSGGGVGIDNLTAGAGGGLIFSGPTTFETAALAIRDVALAAIQREWTSARDLPTRANNLRGLGAGPRENGDWFLTKTGASATILLDAQADALKGGTGEDWFFANRAGTGIRDTITGLTAGIDIADEL